MKKIYYLLFLGILISSVALAEIPKYSKPTEFEFNVYKYFDEKLWNLPPSRTAEEDLISETARKFSITIQDVKTIDVKFLWYEIQIANRDPGFKIGEIAFMEWNEVKKWIDIIGPPK